MTPQGAATMPNFEVNIFSVESMFKGECVEDGIVVIP